MKKVLMAEYLEYNSEFKVGSHHYAKMFAENGYEILWLSPVFNYMTYIQNKKIYLQRKSLNNNKKFIQLDKNIKGYSPYSLFLYGKLPLHDTKFANKLSFDLIIPNLVNVLKENDFYDVDILWLTNVKYYYLAEKLKYKKLFHRCADDIGAFKETCKTMPYFEEKVIKKSDKVFVTSHNLIEKKKNIRNDLIYLPNGVELNNFIKEKYYIPNEYKGNPRLKCIYVGAIDNWFDLDLMEYCIKKNNNIDFYLIGPAKIDLSSLSNYENAFILGKRSYNEIPNYLYYSDVALIPFKVNNLTDSVTPIKLYEYMSLGLNVVSTNFKEMQYINSPAYIANNYDEFCSYIVQAIENKEKNRERNIKFAMENTWEKRFEIILENINK